VHGLHHVAERLHDGVQHGRVEGVGGLEETAGHTFGFEDGLEAGHVVGGPRHHRQRGTVVGRDDHAGGKARLEGVGSQAHGQHRARREVLHQPPARGHEAKSVLEREDAGERGAHELADAGRFRPTYSIHNRLIK
jgi:hypothetical protein